MHTRLNIAIATLAGLTLLAASYAAVHAQSGKSVVDGIYTEEQAKRGQKAYTDNCSFCHGDALEGSDVIPPLAGKDFYTAWSEKTVAELFEKISTTMPATAPGSLKPEEAADVVAYMFSMAKYPAGATEVAAKVDELKQIRIEPPKP